MDIEARILQLIDAKWAVEDIAADVQASTSYVYGVLQTLRPGRKRIRRRKSELRYKISGLLQNGLAPARVAFLCQTSRQYVHRLQKELEGKGAPSWPACK